MIEETFAEGASVFHRLDPRVKIVVAAGFSIVTATAHRQEALWFAAALAAAMIAAARLPASGVARRLLVVNTFVFFLWFTLPFTFPGRTAFALGPLHASAEGLSYSLAVTIKSNAIVAATIALLSTSTVFDLAHALIHMRAPSRLIHIFFFFYRYAHVLQMERARLAGAMRARGFRPGTNLHTYRSYAYLAAMLLVNSYDRALRVRAAMRCRGFRGEYYVLDHFEMRPADAAAGALMIAAVAALALIELGGTL